MASSRTVPKAVLRWIRAYGETVEMKLTLRNAGDEPVSFYLGGSPAYDFVVSTTDGELVWHWMCAKFALASLGNETLEPGEELEFIGEWEQIDNRGEPVPPPASTRYVPS